MMKIILFLLDFKLLIEVFWLNEKSQIFSMNKIWNKLIKDRNLNGLESNQKFYHLNTFEMYKKILSFNITD